MAELNDIRLKERNADYFYESFERYYNQGNYLEACLSFWKSAQLIIASIASFENKEIKDITQAKAFLQKFVQDGDISLSEVSALEIIYFNRLRVNSDEAMLSLQLERSTTLLKKLRQILKDYMINGPPKEENSSIPAASNTPQDSSEAYSLPETNSDSEPQL